MGQEVKKRGGEVADLPGEFCTILLVPGLVLTYFGSGNPNMTFVLAPDYLVRAF